MKELTISIVAIGEIASGKTTAINAMVDGLKEKFEIIAQQPSQLHIMGVETYTFRVRIR